MSTSCLSIKDTSVCAPYNTGLFIDTSVISKTYDIDINVLKDNATIWEWAIIGATSGKQNSGQILSWADWIQCTGYNGEPVQYFRSYDCYTDIFVLSAGCNNLSPASVPPLCTKACDTYGAAIKSLINNITLCTATQHPQALENRQNAVNAAESCNGVADGNNAFKSQSFCINGIESDQKTCGFSDEKVAIEYCKNNKNDKCCDSRKVPSLTRNVVFIATGGVFVLFALIAYFCC